MKRGNSQASLREKVDGPIAAVDCRSGQRAAFVVLRKYGVAGGSIRRAEAVGGDELHAARRGLQGVIETPATFPLRCMLSRRYISVRESDTEVVLLVELRCYRQVATEFYFLMASISAG
jgi:hypothetical protein